MSFPFTLLALVPFGIQGAGTAATDTGLTLVTTNARLVAADTAAGDALGSSVAIQGEHAYAGAPGHDPAFVFDAGAVHAFERIETEWLEAGKITAADGQTDDRFGTGVDVDLDTLVVGAPGVDDLALDAGAAYVFVRSGTDWVEQAKLLAPDGLVGDAFGSAVAVSGERLIVGAPLDDILAADAGSAYVFERSGTSWSFVQKLVRPNQMQGNVRAGSAVGIDGDVAAMTGAGIFVREAGIWVRKQGTGTGGGISVCGPSVATDRAIWVPDASTWEVQSSVGSLDPDFVSVALDGERLLIGDYGRDYLTGEIPGTLYALARRPAGAGEAVLWSRPFRFDSGAALGDRYGAAVALSGRRAIVGAPGADDAGLDSGAVAFVALGQAVAAETLEPLAASDPAPGRWLGYSLASDGQTAVAGTRQDELLIFERQGSTWSQAAAPAAVGSPPFVTQGAAVLGDRVFAQAELPGVPASGTVAVFRRSGSGWVEETHLAPSAAEVEDDDAFGRAIAVFGETALVSALYADNPGAVDSGAAYVFVRDGTSWSQQARLSGNAAGTLGGTGWDVALEGDRAALGVPFADPLTPGLGVGAVYVFRRTGTVWVEEALLVASDGHHNANFGWSVDFDDDRLFVGSPDHYAGIGSDDHVGRGKVYVFERSGSVWTEVATVGAELPRRTSFGQTVRADLGRLVVGAPEELAGTVYVYELEHDGWRLQRSLRDPAAETEDAFGRRVGLAGGWLLTSNWKAEGNAGGVYAFELDDAFASLCDGRDGSLAACPCGNAGFPDAGCDLEQGTGGVRLDIAARTLAPENRATAVGTGFPASFTPSATLVRSPERHAAGAVVFGDGAFCLANPVVRLGGAIALGGTTTHVFGHGAMAGTGSFYYQLHYRNTPAMYCTPEAFNVSNGRRMSW